MDETGVRLADGNRLYGMAAVLTDDLVHSEITTQLRSLVLPGKRFLHHYDETLDRRLMIAKSIAGLPLVGALLMMRTTTDAGQEEARKRLLNVLLPRLQHGEQVGQVVIESRSGSDKHDRRTRDRLRRSRTITDLRVDHVQKASEPLVWLPDFVAGAYFAAHYHGQPEPWSIIESGHLVEVITVL
ncbi:hypothetical protein [Umezawaea tangerina]|uniref:hypothetical protein n=1 Tax=Umezawaea tangerina TaxID=84725 RepID=UPI000D07E542|nr:hypothetical protein [Umezawaea tangerina]